jgi:hypothetical protein
VSEAIFRLAKPRARGQLQEERGAGRRWRGGALAFCACDHWGRAAICALVSWSINDVTRDATGREGSGLQHAIDYDHAPTFLLRRCGRRRQYLNATRAGWLDRAP